MNWVDVTQFSLHYMAYIIGHAEREMCRLCATLHLCLWWPEFHPKIGKKAQNKVGCNSEWVSCDRLILHLRAT